MADYSAEIARLEAILNEGTTSVSVDGRTVTYDLDAIRQRLRELKEADSTQRGTRPVAASIDLSGW